MAVVRATLVYVFIALYILIVAPIGMAWTFFSRDTTFIYGAARLCVRMAGWMCRVKVIVRGREKVMPGQNYVFLSNHQGNFDGPVLLHVLACDFRALIKKEMMRIPVLSLVMRQVQFVPIDRSNPIQARAGLEHGARLLRQGYSFIAFPEGTRSRDGRLRPFKKGVFLMALRAGTPILPITILNTRTIQPPGAYGISPGTVEVIFHDAIPTTSRGSGARNQLVERTRAAIAGALENQHVPPACDEASIEAGRSASSP